MRHLASGHQSRTDPYLRHLTDRLPFGSPALGGAALVAVVAVPHTLLARRAWCGDGRTDVSAVAAGSLLIGWIGVEALVIRERSVLEPLYLGIGALVVASGRRAVAALARRAGVRRRARLDD